MASSHFVLLPVFPSPHYPLALQTWGLMVTRLLLNRFLLAASLLAAATPCGVPGTDAPPLTGLCTDTEWATAIVLPRSLLPGGVSGSSKSCTPENGLCLFQDKDLSVTRVEGVAGGTTIEIGSSGCPNHPIESGKATAAPVKTKTNYIEVAGSLTFPLVSSASAFTTPMRRGVVKALAAQCGADVDDVELSVANVSSSGGCGSGGRRRVLLGVGGVVVK